MKLSDLQEKDVVNVNDGRNVGRIIDAQIDESGKINYLVVDTKKGIRGFFSSYQELTITFDKIKRIGTDVILVDL
ncbi:MAG: YlmC/YmxH family sporulation protein [Bacilli bacterium]|nr:YlmC/YmxH family sporulation protein [Bacilli bacterium]